MAGPENPRQADLAAERAPGTAGPSIRAVMDGAAAKWLDPNRKQNPFPDGKQMGRHNAGGVRAIDGLFKGYLTQIRTEWNTIPGASGPKQRRVNFLYNPTTVAVNYGIDTSVYPEQSRSVDDTAPVLGATSQTLSFTLYFNRMYEVMHQHNNKGVLADVQALEYILGSHNGSGLQATEVVAVLGASTDGTPFAYAGWISDLNVEYLQFSRRMIPTVAMVQVGMVRRFMGDDPAQTAANKAFAHSVMPNVMSAVDAIASLVGGFGSPSRTSAPPSVATGSGQNPRQADNNIDWGGRPPSVWNP